PRALRAGAVGGRGVTAALFGHAAPGGPGRARIAGASAGPARRPPTGRRSAPRDGGRRLPGRDLSARGGRAPRPAPRRPRRRARRRARRRRPRRQLVARPARAPRAPPPRPGDDRDRRRGLRDRPALPGGLAARRLRALAALPP